MMSLLDKHTFALAEFPLDTKDFEVIYIENDQDKHTNHFVRNNLEQIEKIFRREKIDFIFIPSRFQLKDLAKMEEKAKYLMPWLNSEETFQIVKARDFDNKTLNLFGKGNNIQSGVFASNGTEFIGYSVQLQNSLELELFRQIAEAYGKEKRNAETTGWYSPIMESPHDDYNFENRYLSQVIRKYHSLNEEYEKTEERKHKESGIELPFERELEFYKLVERIKKLRPNSVEREIIRKALDSTTVISTLHITNRFDIILPEYPDVEINMPPMCKALYILLLRHPEGISTYDMMNYTDELYSIYSKISRRSNNAGNRASVERIIDRHLNARSEAISRIRAAFESQFSMEIAKMYIILRDRNGILKINLPADKIIWD